MPPHIVNFLLGSFGIVAAVLLVGGSVLLRLQRNRNRFELLKQAMASGQPLPRGVPMWLVSRQQAMSLLAVGVGLMIVGGVAWSLGEGVSQPTETPSPVLQPTNYSPTPGEHPTPPPPPPPRDPMRDRWEAAQVRITVGQTSVGCGIILTLLGIVRAASVATERAHEEKAV